jgi:hypothetical protein
MEPRPIVFKEWRDTRTFSNLKFTYCTLLILLIINLVTKQSLCIVSKVQSIKLFAPCGTLKVQRTITLHSLKIMESFDNRFISKVDFKCNEVSTYLNHIRIFLFFTSWGEGEGNGMIYKVHQSVLFSCWADVAIVHSKY